MSNQVDDMRSIVQENADLIHLVIMSVFEPEYLPQLESILIQAENNGWTSLVAAIRKVIAGERNIEEFRYLDNEDLAVVTSILEGIVHPTSLPELTYVVNPAIAGPVIARLIHAAGMGSPDSNNELTTMASQMAECGGDLARIASIVPILVEGERDKEALYSIMGGSGIALMDEILKELDRLDA
jgi:hypothetical protein